MESIQVPERYFAPNPLDDLTEEDFRDPNGALQYFIDSKAVVIEDGKARWIKRYKNRFLRMYSVRFVKSGEEEVQLDQICGKIIFDVFKIFDQKPGGNPYAINKKGFARLKGPMCPVDGWSQILLYPRMYRRNQPGDFYHLNNSDGYKKFLKGGRDRYDYVPDIDAVGLDGKWILDPDFPRKPFNTLITEEIKTICGTMKFAYAMFEDAIDSFVTIKLLEWNGIGPAPNVYGRICASNTSLPHATSAIFNLKRCEAIPVSPQHYIPINRPVNIVSAGHSLKLSIRIMHKNVGSRGDDLVIAKHTFSLEAECMTYGRGEDGIIDTTEVSGECGKLEVKVYWLPSWSKTFYSVEEDSEDEDTIIEGVASISYSQKLNWSCVKPEVLSTPSPSPGKEKHRRASC